MWFNWARFLNKAQFAAKKHLVQIFGLKTLWSVMRWKLGIWAISCHSSCFTRNYFFFLLVLKTSLKQIWSNVSGNWFKRLILLGLSSETGRKWTCVRVHPSHLQLTLCCWPAFLSSLSTDFLYDARTCGLKQDFQISALTAAGTLYYHKPSKFHETKSSLFNL